VPSDDWDRPGDPVEIREVSHSVAPDPGMMARLAADLASARKPVFVIGQAMANAGVWEDMVALAELHSAPVFSAPHTGRIAFPEGHPLYAGTLMWDRAPLVEALEGHDLIVVLGAPAFICHVEGHGPFIPEGSRLWQVIDDPAIASWTPVGTAVVGNLKLAMPALLDSPPKHERTAPDLTATVPAAPSIDHLSAALIWNRIQAVRPDKRVVVAEAPTATLGEGRRNLKVDEPDGYYSGASGGLGYGLAAAVGVALHEKERRVIAVIGDGSSMYSIQALWTAAKLRLPMTFIIINNRSYGALVMLGKFMGLSEPFGSVIDELDFVQLAGGMNVAAEMVDDASQLDTALARAVQSNGPYLLEVRTNGD